MAAPKGNQGIYKIVSPKGRIYIGQTLDFEKRFAKYKLLHCKGQIRLYNSFLKYGTTNHEFTIVECCPEDEMNERERFWQEYYDVVGKTGLNCKLTSTKFKKGRHSIETRDKISKSHIGKKTNSLTKEKQRAAKIDMDVVRRQEWIGKLRKANLGKKMSDSVKHKMSERMKGNKYTLGMTPRNAKKVKNTSTKVIYDSITEAAKSEGMKRSTLALMLSGQNNNTTNLKLLAS